MSDSGVYEMDVHPAADAFPMMNREQYEALRDDIKEHGQQEDVVTWNNLIIDGRNRLKACKELGIEPEVAELDPDMTPDPTPYVISANIHRRHLTTAQRATVAAKLATLKNGQRKDGARSNDLAVSDAADLLSVSEPSVKRAKHVIANGSKELVQAVERGDVNLNQATKLVKAVEDKREQTKVVREGKEAIKAVSQPPKPKPAKPKAEPPTKETSALVEAFKNEPNRLVTLRQILDTLEPHERHVVADWLNNNG